MDLSFDPRLVISQATRPDAAKPSAGGDSDKLLKSCQDFEAIMIQAMFKSMRDSVSDGGLIPKGNDQQIFQDLIDQNVATDMSRKQGIGIADALFRQLQKLQSADK